MSQLEHQKVSRREREGSREDGAQVAERALEGTAQTTGDRLKARLEAFAEANLPLEAIRTITEAAKMVADIRVSRNAALLVLVAELAAINHANPEATNMVHDMAQESDGTLVGLAMDSAVYGADATNAVIDYIQSNGADKSEDMGFGSDRPAQF